MVASEECSPVFRIYNPYIPVLCLLGQKGHQVHGDTFPSGWLFQKSKTGHDIGPLSPLRRRTVAFVVKFEVFSITGKAPYGLISQFNPVSQALHSLLTQFGLCAPTMCSYNILRHFVPQNLSY